MPDFVWNNLLKEYHETFKIFKEHEYTKLKCNQTTFKTMLTMLKKEHSFLYKSESSSLQQVYRDIIHSFKRFFKNISHYPKFKSKTPSKTEQQELEIKEKQIHSTLDSFQ